MSEDTTITISGFGISDVDADTRDLELTLAVSNGVLTLLSRGSVTFQAVRSLIFDISGSFLPNTPITNTG